MMQIDNLLMNTGAMIYAQFVGNEMYKASTQGRQVSDEDLRLVAGFAKHAAPFYIEALGLIKLKTDEAEPVVETNL